MAEKITLSNSIQYCETCQDIKTEVIDTRARKYKSTYDIKAVFRRRRCPKCQATFTTYEISKRDMDMLIEGKKVIDLLLSTIGDKNDE